LHNIGAMNGNARGSTESFTRGVTRDTELLAEKHRLFRVREDSGGKLLQFAGFGERTPVEHGREPFLEGRSANFNTTSAGDQDES
jgi:hypothetical protein